MKYSWIFFDIDNTLFDFTEASKLAFAKLMDDLGLSDIQENYQVYKKRNIQVWTEFERGDINATELRAKRFDLFFKDIGFRSDPLQANAKYLNGLIENPLLYSETKEVLGQLAQCNIKMQVITNGLKEVQRPRLKSAGLTDYFDNIIVSDEIGVAKPHFDFFDYAANKAGNPDKSKVLVIGDSLNSDIEGGNAFGYDTCWMNPFSKLNETQQIPTFEISNLKEIEVLLK